MQPVPETVIDFHVHLFPDRLFEAIWNHYETLYQWRVKHRLYYRQCVDNLRQRGVGPMVYSNYAHRKGVAETLNAWNLSVLDEFEDVYCFAAYHPDDENAPAMAERMMRHPRVLGFKLQLLVQNFPPHDERLFPLYERVMASGKRLLFHAGTGPVGNPFVGVAHFKKVLARYPELPATVAHMGGYEFKAFFDLLPDHPGLFFDTAFSFLPRAGLLCDLEKETLERFRDRIVYGSDFPNLIFPREEEINSLYSRNLSAAFYHKVFFENGKNLIARHAGVRLLHGERLDKSIRCEGEGPANRKKGGANGDD